MSAIATNASGDYIYLALDDGDVIFVEISRDDLAGHTVIYDPGGGGAGNVLPVPGNENQMIFYGEFGGGVMIVRYDIDTQTITDITPAGYVGTKTINTLSIDPANSDRMIASISIDQDLLYTEDGGTSWTLWDGTVGFSVAALTAIWPGAYELVRYFVAGDNGTDLDLLYSPNEGSNATNLEDGTLAGQANICNLAIVRAEAA